MTNPRPVEELVAGASPLAGAEQRVLREWVASWTFDASEFSALAQPLVRGDVSALKREISERGSASVFADMRETRLCMPAMEVVIAGAQYHSRSDSAASVSRHGRRTGDHDECLRLLHASGVSVDAEDVAGFTAFMRASQTRHSRLDLAQVLLELGADVNHRSRFGGVAMHEAIMAQDRTAVAFLSRNGASMDVRDNDGVSPRDIVSLVL